MMLGLAQANQARVKALRRQLIQNRFSKSPHQQSYRMPRAISLSSTSQVTQLSQFYDLNTQNIKPTPILPIKKLLRYHNSSPIKSKQEDSQNITLPYDLSSYSQLDSTKNAAVKRNGRIICTMSRSFSKDNKGMEKVEEKKGNGWNCCEGSKEEENLGFQKYQTREILSELEFKAEEKKTAKRANYWKRTKVSLN